MWTTKVVAIAITLFGAATALAQAKDIRYEINQQFQSIRAMGMGGAISAAADEHDALLFNPAALARLKDWNINASLIQAGVDKDLKGILDDFDSADNLTGTDETNRIIEIIENNYGKRPNVRVTPLAFFWVWKGFGLGVVPADVSVNLGLDQQIGPSINFTTYADTTIAIGYGRKLKSSENISWGVTAKAINRAFYQDTVTAAQFADSGDFFQEDDVKEGMTFDFDLGLLYTPTIPSSGIFSTLKHARPTFSLVGRSLLDSGFSQNMHLISKESGDGPPNLQRLFDFGSKWELPNLWVFYPQFVFDVRDMGHERWTFKKGYHAGFELKWFVASWLKGAYRVGLNQGYMSLGATAKFAWFQLDAATWGEEVGTSQTSIENRRYLVKASMDF